MTRIDLNDSRVLFLDYDGVLRPDAAYLLKGKAVLRALRQLFMWVPQLLDLLSPHDDVKVVLSTSWARALRFSPATSYLPPPLQARAIGATWYSGMKHSVDLWLPQQTTGCYTASRSHQIKRNVVRAGLRAWLAIDDHPDGWVESELKHPVKTESSTGLSDRSVRQSVDRWTSETAPRGVSK